MDIGAFCAVGQEISRAPNATIPDTSKKFCALSTSDKANFAMGFASPRRSYGRNGRGLTRGRADWRNSLDIGAECNALIDLVRQFPNCSAAPGQHIAHHSFSLPCFRNRSNVLRREPGLAPDVLRRHYLDLFAGIV